MGKITINELHKSLFDYVQAVSDDKLETNNKTIVGAINELFSDNSNDIEINNLKNEISNGKELIANAIGEPLSSEDTFSAMSSDINSLLSTFKTNMMNNGITVESGDKFKALIDKIQGLTEGEGNKGIQFAEGTITTDIDHTFKGTTGNLNVKFDNPLEFTPTYIVLCDVYLRHYAITTNIVTNLSNINASEVGTNTSIILTGLSSTGFNISYTGIDSYGGLNITCSFYNPKYIAIGVGEEDTTLRDSLASILQEEGVEVAEEDDLANLISKVDEEFDNRITMKTGTLNYTNGLVGENNNGKLIITHNLGTIPSYIVCRTSEMDYMPNDSSVGRSFTGSLCLTIDNSSYVTGNGNRATLSITDITENTFTVLTTMETSGRLSGWIEEWIVMK